MAKRQRFIRKRCERCGVARMVRPRYRTCYLSRPKPSIYSCGGKLVAAPIQRAPKPQAADAPLLKLDREIAKAKTTTARHLSQAKRSQTAAVKWTKRVARLERQRAEIAAQLVTFAGQQVRTGSLTDHRARGIALGDE